MPVTVLGIGNPIMGDDGVGLAVLAELRQLRPDPRVEYSDGGTGGLELLPQVQDAGKLLLLDAVSGDIPGQVLRFSGDHLPRLLSSKLSPHEVGLLDVLSAARLTGKEPEAVEIVGVVPQVVEMRVGLSTAVAAAVAQAAALAAEILDSWLAP
ncbi:MAG: hydrogenase maturation protease [Propionibacteriaceae bacterium]|nr:hydrogenase maturation protease [Propionibacteriaceae bacterium]